MIDPTTAFKPSGLLGLAFATAISCHADQLAASIGVPQTEADLSLQIVDQSLIGMDPSLSSKRAFLFGIVNDYIRKSGSARCDDFIYNAKLCYVPEYKVRETVYFLRALRGAMQDVTYTKPAERSEPAPQL